MSAITTEPLGATATLLGALRLALVAAMPLPKLPATPLPASVVIVPAAETMRTRLSFESLMTKPPVGIGATLLGPFSLAAVAGPPSPQALVGVGQGTPVPATRVMTPVADTFRTLWPWSSVMRNPPPGSGTARSGPFSCAAVAAPPSPQAAAVLAQGAPVPATVVTTPVEVTMRMRLLERSAIRSPPNGRAATPVG